MELILTCNPEMLICELEEYSAVEVFGTIVLKFCIIALGGPVFGYFMARIAIFCLSKIFNDATVSCHLIPYLLLTTINCRAY